MSNKGYTHLSVIVDRSWSMTSCQESMVKGLKDFFKEQSKIDGVCLVDYVQFDDQYERVFSDRLVASAKPSLKPRGNTALLDAVGRNIVETSEKFKNLPKYARPSKVLVVIVTDGQENASREFTRAQVKELVQKKTKKGWDFVFLGANIDAVREADSFGILRGSALTYDTNNIQAASTSLSGYVTRSRVAGSASFSDEDRKQNETVSTS